MKSLVKPLFTAFSLILLSGCVDMSMNPKQVCWQSCRKTNSCGTCIIHHCEQLCETCKGHGILCDECWECIKHDVCMQ